ncbi:MAG: hypothetical protein QM731_11780 [Chitinophagaceae bacterium]
MNTQQNMEERLWEYIDGTCSAEEKSFIEQLIESHREWKEKYHELLDVHILMQDSLELDNPSMRFTRNVMEEIARHQIAPAAQTYINKKIITAIGAFFVLSIVGFLIYILAQFNWSFGNSTNNLAVNADKFDWTKLASSTSMNIFLGVNVILGLMLLDMYLTRKKKQALNA